MKHSHHSHHSAHTHHSPHDGLTHGQPSTSKASPPQDEVARKAYEIYLAEGCPQGRDVQHWLAAEHQVSG